jgi:hypothetical protein
MTRGAVALGERVPGDAIHDGRCNLGAAIRARTDLILCLAPDHEH